jgi:hypothetical protein
MEFVGKDLEDIQRVAGLLNLTVDELLRQSRSQRQHATDSTPDPSPRLAPSLAQQHQLQQHQPILFSEGQVTASQHHYPLLDFDLDIDLDLDAFDMPLPQPSGPGTERPEATLNPPPAPQPQDTEVILLNPSTTSYDCDMLWGFNQSVVGEMPDFDFEDMDMDLDIPTDPETARISEMELDIESASHHPAPDDGSSEWALVSVSPDPPSLQSPKSASAVSTGRPRPNIAPKASGSSHRKSKSTSEASSTRPAKKPRGRYDGAQRVDTHLTRQLHACVRCRMQRNRVSHRHGYLPIQRGPANAPSASPTRPTRAGPA